MSTATIALIIFILTYVGIIYTKLPGVNVDRRSAAFTGAVAMIVCGVVSLPEAVELIDFNTICLLLGMMIIISTLRLEGFFSLLAQKTITLANTRIKLLWVIVFLTGLCSAFMVNDAVVLLFTPVIITICSRVKVNPMPYLLAEIFSSNIGSVMTITGNPQNMLIGINSGISYTSFLLHLFWVSVLGMVVVVWCVRVFFRKDFVNKDKLVLSGAFEESNICFKDMRISLSVFALLIVSFFFGRLLGLSIPVLALCAAALILIFSSQKPSAIIKEVDWVLLLFFASLFIVVGAVQREGILDPLLRVNLNEDFFGIVLVHALSLFASQIVSNVPFTVVMLPLMKSIDSQTLWLALASSSTLAGNATIMGAMANLIVIGQSEKEGIKIGFWQFFKIGIVVTGLTFVLSI